MSSKDLAEARLALSISQMLEELNSLLWETVSNNEIGTEDNNDGTYLFSTFPSVDIQNSLGKRLCPKEDSTIGARR